MVDGGETGMHTLEEGRTSTHPRSRQCSCWLPIIYVEEQGIEVRSCFY